MGLWKGYVVFLIKNANKVLSRLKDYPHTKSKKLKMYDQHLSELM